MRKDVIMQVGTIWEAGSKEFIIEETKIVNDEYWVFYKNIKTEQRYSCLQGAFLSRFNLVINKEYGIHSRE